MFSIIRSKVHRFEFNLRLERKGKNQRDISVKQYCLLHRELIQQWPICSRFQLHLFFFFRGKADQLLSEALYLWLICECVRLIKLIWKQASPSKIQRSTAFLQVNHRALSVVFFPLHMLFLYELLVENYLHHKISYDLEPETGVILQGFRLKGGLLQRKVECWYLCADRLK